MNTTPITGGRTPPYSEEAEIAVLGSSILDPKALAYARKHEITEETFFVPAHRIIFDCICKLADNHKPVDLISITNHLKGSAQLEHVGGMQKLSKLLDSTPTSSHIAHYTDIILRKHKRRQVIHSAHQAITTAHESNEQEESILSKVKYDFHKIAFFKKALETIPEIVKRLIEKYNIARDHGVYGIASRWHDIARKIICYLPSKITIIAGRPGDGKTTFCLNEVLHKSLQGIPVLILSIEMDREEVVEKLVCDLMGLDSKRFKQGMATLAEIDTFEQGGKIIHELPIYIEHGNFTIEQIGALVREYEEAYKIKMCVVDYIQIVAPTPHIKFANRNAEISHMSQSLVHFANETGVHFFVVSQLSRGQTGGNREQKQEPELHHLRDSGTLEQDAFTVIFIYPDPDVDENIFVTNSPSVIKIAKCRHGEKGKLNITFQKNKSRFVSKDNKTLELPQMKQPAVEDPF